MILTIDVFTGYEVVGLENIPNKGGALVVAFHGALALDMYYLISRVMLVKHRRLYSVVDRFLFRCWGKVFLLPA